MPWYQVLSIILGSIGTLLGIFGFSAYWNERMKHKAQKKNEKEDEAEKKMKQMEQDELLKKISAVFDEKMKPVNDAIATIENDLALVKKGVQVTCRNDLEDIYNIAKKEKFCSDDDKQRFEATYQAYHSLGKNGIMDNKQKIILAMPESKPVTRRKPRAKKQILVEDK